MRKKVRKTLAGSQAPNKKFVNQLGKNRFGRVFHLCLKPKSAGLFQGKLGFVLPEYQPRGTETGHVFIIIIYWEINYKKMSSPKKALAQ